LLFNHDCPNTLFSFKNQRFLHQVVAESLSERRERGYTISIEIISGTWHNVMNRSRRGTELYHDNEDYELFLTLDQETWVKFQRK